MNAPVMVELEGETDPLEVRFVKALFKKNPAVFLVLFAIIINMLTEP